MTRTSDVRGSTSQLSPSGLAYFAKLFGLASLADYSGVSGCDSTLVSLLTQRDLTFSVRLTRRGLADMSLGH